MIGIFVVAATFAARAAGATNIARAFRLASVRKHPHSWLLLCQGTAIVSWQPTDLKRKRPSQSATRSWLHLRVRPTKWGLA